MSELSLADLIAESDASLVLPQRPRGADVVVPLPLQLLDSLPFDDRSGVAIVGDAGGTRWVVPYTRSATTIARAVAGDGIAARLAAMAPDEVPDSFQFNSWHRESLGGERGVEVDQTNDSVIVGDRAVVKWSVRLGAPGQPASPAPHRITTLMRQQFAAMPTPWAVVTWSDGDFELPVATIASYLPGAEDGWDWAVRDVGVFASDRGAPLPLEAPTELGRIAADMHLAFATEGVEHATLSMAQLLCEQAQHELAAALKTLSGDELNRLEQRRRPISSTLDVLGELVGTPLIDIHGDFHVGQILRYGPNQTLAVTDFDGSPVLSGANRVAKQPAAVDVVSMLASLDHVGRVVIKRVEGADPTRVREWINSAQQAFLGEYREVMGSQYETLVDERLFGPLRLQQELREYLYAAAHLPHWRYVPDMALRDLLPDEES